MEENSIYPNQNEDRNGNQATDPNQGADAHDAAFSGRQDAAETSEDHGGQGNPYQSNGYPDNGYKGFGADSSPYQAYTGQNGSYAGSGWQNSAYSAGPFQSYGGGYQQYNGVQPYPDNQLELEEPVKVSEWVLAMLLMMVPCVNIIMMFVWAFSSTEKKSKSNFFKAYLIIFGISMAVMILIWIAIVIFALAL